MRFLLVAVAFIVCAAVADACSCMARTFPEHYCQADATLECQFTSRRENLQFVVYNCKVQRVWKGNITSRTIQVVTPKSSSLCGVTFLSGCNAPTYLITGRIEVFNDVLNQKVLHTTLCDFSDSSPADRIFEFLKAPSCPCATHRCEAWQDCLVYERPNCDATAQVKGTTTVDGIAFIGSQVSGDTAVATAALPCSISYCADNCDRFPCPGNTTCKLQTVECLTQPCPPVARCVSVDPCSLVLCAPNHVCKVLDNGSPVCVPECPVCPVGYHCEKRESICPVAGFCPPAVPVCVPDVVVDPCSLAVDVGAYLDAADTDEVERFYFDKNTRECVKFMYRGSGGNDNNFLTDEECDRVCPNIPPCKQRLITGPCDAKLDRFFYNATSQRCEPFVYGGCGGNDNNFETLAQCDQTCPPPDPCPLPLSEGKTCSGGVASVRWWNNAATGRCESFRYLGCDGNGNSFATEQECQRRCPPPNPCTLALAVGVGDRKISRWWHNPEVMQCEEFFFRGTGGNANNFETADACKLQCKPPNPCRLAADPGPCRAFMSRWFYNYQNGQCERFTYGGCRGNSNNFETLAKCQAQCRPVNVCKLPREVGSTACGGGRNPRWSYNPLTRRCERFIYLGCGGNQNNFLTRTQCERRCLRRCDVPEPCSLVRCAAHQTCRIYPPTGQPYCADTCNNFPCAAGSTCKLVTVQCVTFPCPPKAVCVPNPKPDVCELPAQPGLCKAYIPRWFFNSASGQCEQFIFGGCGGNSNNFVTAQDCMRACRPPGVCRLPKSAGSCDLAAQSLTRWAFNSNTGTCEQFAWSGCGGNRNRFVSQAACNAVCPSVPPCKQPKFSCKTTEANCVCTAQLRYYFDAKTASCQLYPGGECPLNGNAYNTLAECQNTCNVQRCSLAPEKGPCDCAHVRWYFDSQVGGCRRFVWGGCKGNSNNFETESACKAACAPSKCSLPLVRGRGTDRAVRFFYNAAVGHCQSFQYFGLDGNENNFDSLEACERECAPQDVCPGCAVDGLVSVPVARNVLEANVQFGWCCLANSAQTKKCCCPATSDRAASCVRGSQYFPVRPIAVEETPVETEWVPEDLDNPEDVDPAVVSADATADASLL